MTRKEKKARKEKKKPPEEPEKKKRKKRWSPSRGPDRISGRKVSNVFCLRHLKGKRGRKLPQKIFL